MSTGLPSISRCKAIIHSPKDSVSEGDLVLAAFTLMEHLESDPAIGIDDGLVLLEHPGVIAEIGARILYVRTGRDGLGWGIPEESAPPFSTCKDDWLKYLGR